MFVGYVTAGYRERADTVPVLLALEAGGTDVIELGVPFTDPLADGATVQQANEVALAQGVSFGDCLAFVKEARAQGLLAPVILMGYYNPILAYGTARACRDTAAAGADGFIIVDLPPDEEPEFLAEVRHAGLALVPLIAPTTEESRVPVLTNAADAFVYCVSVTGTTGKGNVNLEGLPPFLARVRRHTALPIAVGFGITKREHVEAVGKLADAAVIGSAIIATIDAAPPDGRARRVREFVEDVTGH